MINFKIKYIFEINLITKKAIRKIIVLTCAALIVLACNNDDLNTSKIADYSNKILGNETFKGFGGDSISFTIGRNSKECRGFVICSIRKVSVIIDQYSITWNNQNRPVINCNYLLIDKSIVEEFKVIQGGDDLLIDESFAIDCYTADSMGLTANFSITSGKYPIVYDPEIEIYKILITNGTV